MSEKNEEFDLRTNPFKERGDDMNPTTDHFHVPERAITKRNTKKIKESNQGNNGVADIGK